MQNYIRLWMMSFGALIMLGAVLGCSIKQDGNRIYDASLGHAPIPSPGPSYLDIHDAEVCDPPLHDSLSPMTLADYQNVQYTAISLEECIARALGTSEVIRDLGVSIIRSPGSMVTSLDPAQTYTDARFGEEAALSEFDASVSARAFFEKNDRPFNNRFSGDTDGFFRQDLHNYEMQVSKLAATGTQFSMGHRIEYDANNQAGNRFGSAWQTLVESEFRHPLLQGNGVLFNRIAGPSQEPGVYNGVLIARTNTEISLVRFEQGVQNLVSNVESAYWDLFFAYRELEAQTQARDAALALYQQKQAGEASERSSSLDTISAKEQYLRFENNIIDSLEGRPVDGTRTDNGIAGGAFRNSVGVRTAERRLRYLLGMPITDGSLLQPADMPFDGAVVFDWDESLQQATLRRPEVRQQRWVVKQRQLELTAARNFLMPRLDLVGRYRFRGLGKNLTGGSNTFADDVANNTDVSNAYGDLVDGDYQEWQLGAEMQMPVGFRRAHNAVRNAEVNLQREKALVREQERAITLGLSNAVAELRRSYAAMQLAEERYKAAYQYKQQSAEKVKNNAANIDVQLEAERRVLDSKLQFLRAEVEYMLAIRNVHYERGTLLEYNGVFLTEGESDPQAYVDAGLRFEQRRRTMNYVVKNPSISQPLASGNAAGSFPPVIQHADPTGFPAAMQVDEAFSNGTLQPAPLAPQPTPADAQIPAELGRDEADSGQVPPIIESVKPLDTGDTSASSDGASLIPGTLETEETESNAWPPVLSPSASRQQPQDAAPDTEVAGTNSRRPIFQAPENFKTDMPPIVQSGDAEQAPALAESSDSVAGSNSEPTPLGQTASLFQDPQSFQAPLALTPAGPVAETVNQPLPLGSVTPPVNPAPPLQVNRSYLQNYAPRRQQITTPLRDMAIRQAEQVPVESIPQTIRR